MQQLLTRSFCILHSALCIAVALAAASATARSVSVTGTNLTDGVASSFDLAIGAGENAEGLYMAYGNLDGGDDIDAWENVSKVADIPAATTSYTASAPVGWGTSVTALRFFMATVADLPYDIRYEYIYSTGVQSADTGYLPTSDTKVAIDMSMQSNNGSTYIPVWGYRKSAGVDAFALFINKNYREFALNFKNTDVKAAATLNPGERFIYRNDNTKQYLTRVERGESEVCILDTTPSLQFTAPAGYTLGFNGFKNGKTTSVENRSLAMRVYGMKIWEGDTLLRDYVPALKDGNVGLYDLGTQSMLLSQWTSADAWGRPFIAGPILCVNGGFTSSTAAPATVFALGEPLSGAASRTVAITSTNRVSGAISSVGVSFPPSFATNYLYLAYGAADGGNVPADWDHLDFVKVVKPYELSATVAVPEGWGDSVLAFRLFLGEPPAKPYDYDVEWLGTTGSQWIDTGIRLRYGQTVSVTWRQNSLSPIYNADMGWSAGYGTSGGQSYSIIGGGNRNNDKLIAYLVGTSYQFSPVFYTSRLTDTTIYRDECVIGDDISFTMTDTATGDVWSLATSPATPGGSAFETPNGLFLGRSSTVGDWLNLGKKAFYGVTIKTTATGEDVANLVPVVKDGAAFMYDTVSGTLYGKSGDGDFLIGPAIETPRLPSTVFPAASATVSLVGLPQVVAGEVADVAGSYSSVRIGYDVRSLGAAQSVAVRVLYGPAADSLPSDATLAAQAGLGAGSGVLGGLMPGRTYYARLVAGANGAEGEPSPVFTFTCPAPDATAGGSYCGRPFESLATSGGTATATFETYFRSTPLYMAYGADYGVETTNGWEHVVKVADVAADATSASFALPAGWGASVRFMRCFFMVAAAPDGDAFLDSIVCSGAQYVDTGIYPDRNLRVEMRAKVNSGASNDWVPFLGQRRTSNVRFNFVLWAPKNPATAKVRPNCGNQQFDIGDCAINEPAGATNIYSLGVQSGLVVNGEVSADPSRFVDTQSVANQSLPLFGLRSDGALDNRMFFGACFGFKAYSNDTVTAALVPFSRGGVAGLYDIVKDEFHPSASATPFAAGSLSSGDLCSFSDPIIAPDVSMPSIGEVSDDGGWRGDRLAVTGVLASGGAGGCTIAVETSRLGDFSDAVSWPCAGTYGTEDAFAAELYEADTSSPAYIRPGETLWYRVRVTDGAGRSDYSLPASVTTFAALAVGTPSISMAGRAFTVTVPVSTLGANTGCVWVAYSMGTATLDRETVPVAVPHDYDGASVTVQGVAPSAGAMYWSLVVSNGCSTAAWTSRSNVRSATLSNNIRYTWKSSVANGAWEDAASWDAPEGRLDYPTSESEAYFLGGTTARVEIATSLVQVRQLYVWTGYLDVVFHGGAAGTGHKLLVSDTLFADGVGGTICVSNLNFEVSRGGVTINENRLLKICGGAQAAFYNSGDINICKGPRRHLEISGGSYLQGSGSLRIGGAGSTVVVDDSRLDMYAWDKGVFFSCDANGGELIVRGRNARVEAAYSFRTAWDKGTGGTLTFVIPENGFAATPVEQVPYAHSTSWQITRPFAGEAPENQSHIQPLAIRIDPSSPGLSASQTICQPLVSWKGGLSLEKMTLEPIPVRRNSNRFAYAAAFDETDGPYGWETSWTDADAPLTLGFIHEHAATVILLR